MSKELSILNFRTEIKADEKTGVISGYASTYHTVDNGNDIVMPGAFDASIAAGNRVKMLWQHDPSQVIGVWTAMASDSKGLHIEGRLLKGVSKADEAAILIEAEALDGLSIGYTTVKADRNSKGQRELKELRLWEVSLVTFPMNVESTITAMKKLHSVRDVEHILRDAGVPNAMAKAIAVDGYDVAVKKLAKGERDAPDARSLSETQKLLKKLKEQFDA